MSDNSPTGKSSSDIEVSLRQHDIRALTCFAAAGTAITHVKWPEIDWLLFGVGLAVGVYTVISYFLIKRRDISQHKVFDHLMVVDAAIIGAILSLCNFSVLPTIMFVTMVQFNGLINGGIRKWGLDTMAMLFGVLASFSLRIPEWNYSSRLEISSLSLLGIFAYFCAYALYAYNRMRKLTEQVKRLSSEHTLYKLKTYKLARYLPPTVWKAISEGREQSLTTERKRVTVFFSDIQGFSTLAEELEAETLTELLNSYLTEMSRIAAKHKGTIDKFMGDGIMVIFGDAQSEGMKMDCLRCVSMAIEMRKKMQELQTRWYNQGIKKPMLIRIGINTGYCTVGSFGTSHYMDYTVLGTHANIASRLESAAEPGEILISHETWSLVKDVVMCRDQGEINVKGLSNPVRIYQVVDFRKDLGKGQTWFEESMTGFSMHMDLEKIRNYDKDRVVELLNNAAAQLKNKTIK
jgi:class 3 adenylate cyclase